MAVSVPMAIGAAVLSVIVQVYRPFCNRRTVTSILSGSIVIGYSIPLYKNDALVSHYTGFPERGLSMLYTLIFGIVMLLSSFHNVYRSHDHTRIAIHSMGRAMKP